MNTFPTDNETLKLVREACDTRIVDFDADGNPVMNGQHTLFMLLDIFSGYDPEKSVEVNPALNEYDHPTYHMNDLVRALTDEIFRLRGVAFNGPSEP